MLLQQHERLSKFVHFAQIAMFKRHRSLWISSFPHIESVTSISIIFPVTLAVLVPHE